MVEESMHVIFDESNSLDPRKDIGSINDYVGDLMETNVQEENASKHLKFEGPSKEDSEEMPQPTLKDDLPKDWQFKKAHP